MNARRFFLVSAAFALLFPAGLSSAGTATSNLAVSSSISANCTISTAAIAFGAYDPIVANLSSPLNATGSVTTTCTGGTSPVITLGQGGHANTGSTEGAPVRQMAKSSDLMSYQLYSDSGRNTVWGNTAGSSPAAVAGDGTAQTFTVYGSVAGGQNLPTGSYTDTVVATVTF